MSSRSCAALAIAAILCASAAAPANAQEDFEAIVTAMRACARIGEVTARVSCYDKTITPVSGGAVQAPPSRSPTAAGAAAPGGFGADALRRERVRDASEDAVRLRVTQAVEREPGVFRLTFEDGGQWQFVDAAPLAYDAPSAGDVVGIERASLGGFLMRFADQRSIRIQRIR